MMAKVTFYPDYGIELATCLTGDAREILSCLPPDLEDDYHSLVHALSTRFDPEGKESKYSAELMERVCSNKEDVATFGHQIRRLARKAYPNNDLPERVLIDLFIRGLPSEEMKRHVSSFEPNSLAEAIRRATLCETYGEKTNKSKKPLPDDTIATIMKTKPVQTAPPPTPQFQPPPQPFQSPPPSFQPQVMPPPLMQIPLNP